MSGEGEAGLVAGGDETGSVPFPESDGSGRSTAQSDPRSGGAADIPDPGFQIGDVMAFAARRNPSTDNIRPTKGMRILNFILANPTSPVARIFDSSKWLEGPWAWIPSQQVIIQTALRLACYEYTKSDLLSIFNRLQTVQLFNCFLG